MNLYAKTLWLTLLCMAGGLALSIPVVGLAEPQEPQLLPYHGRLVDPNGAPVTGPVDLEIGFYGSEYGNDMRTKAPFAMRQVVLDDGVFTVRIAVNDRELAAIFAGDDPFLQVTDVTHQRTYRRLRYYLPEGVSLAASRDAPALPTPGELPTAGIRAAAASACLATPVAGTKFVTETTNLTTTCAAVCTTAAPSSGCVRGWTLYGDGRYFDYGNECLIGNVPPGERPTARVCCCQNLAGPGPLFLRSDRVAH